MKKYIAQLKKEIEDIEGDIYRMSLTNLSQQDVYQKRQNILKQKLQHLVELKEEQQISSYYSVLQAQLKHFQETVKIQLEKQSEIENAKAESLRAAVSMQYVPEIRNTEHQIQEEIEKTNDQILKQALPEKFLADYEFMKQYTAELRQSSKELHILLEKQTQLLKSTREYEKSLMKQAMQQRELLKECKKREEELRERLQVEIIYNNEKQKALLEAKVAPVKKESR